MVENEWVFKRVAILNGETCEVVENHGIMFIMQMDHTVPFES